MNQKLDDFFEKVITVKWGPDRESVDIIDQTLLPGTIKRIQIRTQEEIWEAIKKLRVRGGGLHASAAQSGRRSRSSGRRPPARRQAQKSRKRDQSSAQ